MALTDLERVRVSSALERLNRKKQGAEARLAEEKSSNVTAWSQYGSELCAGSMHAGEDKIREEIKDIQRLIELLTAYQAGIFSISEARERVIKKQIRDAEKKIQLQKELKEASRQELIDIKTVRDLVL